MNSHIRFDADEGALHLLDQRLLPEAEADVVCRTPDDVIDALKTMVVRGAPAIGVTAAFGCALAVRCAVARGGDAARRRLEADLERLAAARPTAFIVSPQKRNAIIAPINMPDSTIGFISVTS